MIETGRSPNLQHPPSVRRKRHMPARCLVATCQTWSSTTSIPALLAGAGATIVSFSPGPLGLSRDVCERISCSREPATAAAELRALLLWRTFDWIIVADELLLSALADQSDRLAPCDWLPVDPGDRRALDVLLSKHAFAELAPGLGIDVPPSRLANSTTEALAHAEELGYPVVLKGDRGFGGLEVAIARDAAALRRTGADLLASQPRILVQRYIAGERISACALYAGGRLVAYKAYRAQCSYPDEQSASTVHERFSHPSMETTLATVGDATGFHGMAGIDFMYDRELDVLYAIEINPRPTIGFAGTASDRNFFVPVVAELMRGDVRHTPAVYDGCGPAQSYFPGYLFYLATTSGRGPGSYSKLVSCLREMRLREWRLISWETARFAYDLLVRATGVRRRRIASVNNARKGWSS